MFSLIGMLLKEGVGFFTDKAKHKREMQSSAAKNTQRLLEDDQSNNHDWEMANLQDKDKWMRRISFAMFTWPFIWIYFDAVGAQLYFEVLNQYLPNWYKQTYMAMTGGIWGISALKNAVPSLLNGIVNAVRKN